MGFVLTAMGKLDPALDCFNTAIKHHEIHELRGSARPASAASCNLRARHCNASSGNAVNFVFFVSKIKL